MSEPNSTAQDTQRVDTDNGTAQPRSRSLESLPRSADGASSGPISPPESTDRRRAPGRSSSTDSLVSGSTLSRKAVFIMGSIARFVKDMVTFLVRGGLSSLMFLMDQALSAILVITTWIPGGVYINYTIRFAMWIFQLVMWVVYTALELIFYLPMKLAVPYIVFLAVVYVMLPDVAHSVLSFIFWLAHSFLHFLQDVVFENYEGHNRNKTAGTVGF